MGERETSANEYQTGEIAPIGEYSVLTMSIITDTSTENEFKAPLSNTQYHSWSGSLDSFKVMSHQFCVLLGHRVLLCYFPKTCPVFLHLLLLLWTFYIFYIQELLFCFMRSDSLNSQMGWIMFLENITIKDSLGIIGEFVYGLDIRSQ